MSLPSWPHGATHSDPGGDRLPRNPHRFRLYLPPRGSDFLRRTAIGVISGLLVLGALFLAGPNGAPGFARELVWDTQDGVPAPAVTIPEADQGNEQAPPVPASDLSALSKQPAAPTLTPKLDPLPQWVQSPAALPLWSRSSSPYVTLATVPEKVQLRVLGQPENGRLPVYYDDGKPGGERLGGWVDPGNVVASEGPAHVVASSRGGARPNPDLSTPDKFISVVAEAAREAQLDTKVPASVTIAQAILESDWGRSLLSTKANNFFGIKATKAPGPAGVVSMNSWEVLGGQNVTVKDAFKAYNNLWESVADHGQFLSDNPRYAAAFKVLNDAQEFARRIHAAGYATDPGYSTKLINLMNKFNLYQYDLPLP